MGRLLVTLATLLVFLLGAAFVAPAFVDWKSYRLDIEQAASALLGRKITIVGDIDIALLPEPHLHAKKVIAEGGPSEAAQMTAEAVDLTLSLQGLLSGRIETSKLKFLNPFLILDLSKPLQSGSAPREGRALSIGAEVTSLEIEGGRISVYPDAGKPEALTLTGVDGTLAAPQQRGNPYRFTGRVSQKNQRYDVKFAAAAHGGGVKLAGSAIELQSKAAIQADGVLTMSDAPVFDGTLAATAPQALVGAPFDIQAKGGAKLNSAGLALSDLVLTMDPGNRPQILTGSASVAFAPGTADISLQARSLDADVLLSGGAGSGAQGAPVGWDTFQTALVQLLWFYPEFGVHLSLASDQIQLRGELIEGAKAEGQRAAQRWLFEDARATLPGETSMRLTGALKKTAGKPELMARVAVDGKNLGRLNRWIAPPAANAKTAPARVFTAGGLLTLSDDITAFTDVKGKLDGVPFTASLRLDKTPARKLKVSLAGDSFDLTSLEAGQTGPDALSGESIKAAWQSGLAQLAPLLGEEPANFETADIDVSAGSLRTSLIEAKNVAVQLKYDQDLLTVTKLSAETADGLSLRGEGVVPMRSVGQGRFDGRLEANSPQAVLRAVALAGYNADSIAGRRAEDLAPVKLAMNYSADGQASGATAQLSGTLGAVRLDGRVQLKGALAEWRAGQFTGQLALSGADGNKLIALLFPKAGLAAAASASPGAITIRASGAPGRLDTSATIKAPS
ncbi:MAG: AsmA family protein, partial [Rhodomicrobium sp.]